jgi:hypothetical protein
MSCAGYASRTNDDVFLHDECEGDAVPSNDLGNQRRINEVLSSYWHMQRGERPYPLEQEIDVDHLMEIWDSCFLVRVESHAAERKYTYLHLGSALVTAYGGTLDDKEICEKLVFPSNMSLVHKFDEVVNRAAPILDESEFTNSRNVPVRYRSIMLPLGQQDGKVGFIIGGMRWKSY